MLYDGMVCSRAVRVAYLFLCFLVEVPFFKPFLQQTFFIRVNLPLLKYYRMEYEVFMKRSWQTSQHGVVIGKIPSTYWLSVRIFSISSKKVFNIMRTALLNQKLCKLSTYSRLIRSRCFTNKAHSFEWSSAALNIEAATTPPTSWYTEGIEASQFSVSHRWRLI